MNEKLSTDPYKGVRDFYPEDAAIQQYIFDTWRKTAESFGFERYNASILEPSTLYKSKGAENEEMVKEQTYTFIDRGDREVTLRPEMTPTVARMVAAKKRELPFPLRWYSIPNLFRYERPQRGRLREHWQLNCDIFGCDDISADIEIITLAYQTLIDFGANPDMFEIRVNSRKLLEDKITPYLKNANKLPEYLRLLDKKMKISLDEFVMAEAELLQSETSIIIEPDEYLDELIQSLATLGISNVKFNSAITRGFNYYTGTIFEMFDTSKENNRSLLGGGRYNNLTSMFGGESISGIGFGMGDVGIRDFLETHNLLPDGIKVIAPRVTIIPETPKQNLFSQKIAKQIRKSEITVSVDIGTQKVDKKKARAESKGSKFITIIGEKEASSGNVFIKNLMNGEEYTGTIDKYNFN